MLEKEHRAGSWRSPGADVGTGPSHHWSCGFGHSLRPPLGLPRAGRQVKSMGATEGLAEKLQLQPWAPHPKQEIKI